MSRNSENKQEIEDLEKEQETKDLEKKQEIEAQQIALKLYTKQLIDKIEAITDSDPEGLARLLDLAIKVNCLPAVESAFNHGAKIINFSCNHFGTLVIAVMSRNLEIVRLVLERALPKDALPILNEEDLYRGLISAFQFGEMEIINLILDKMKDQGLIPDFSSFPLEMVVGATGSSEEAVKFAIEKGAPIVNEGDDCDKTLTIAFIVGNMGIINLILDKMKYQGLTPDFSSVLLAYAIFSRSEEAVKFAIEKGAPIVPNILREHKVLETALEGPNQKIIDMVLIAGPPIEDYSLPNEKMGELAQHKEKLLKTIKTEAFEVSFILAKIAFNKEHKNALTSVPTEILRNIASFIENPLLPLAKKAKLLPKSLEKEIFTSVEQTYAKRSAGARSSSSSSSASPFASSEAPVEAAVSNKITGQDSRKNQQKNIGESKEDKSPVVIHEHKSARRPKVEKSGQLKPVKQSEALNQSKPRTFTDIIKSNNQNQGLLLI